MAVEPALFKRVQKHLRRDVWDAWQQYHLIENGDRVMVCLSGGKDSYAMLDLLLHYQKESEIQFEMLERIIGNDFKKLFTVGDMKQAIYGFRGGELGVFKECMEKSPKTLLLNNNYRSLHSVIDFNNYVFDYLFKLGQNYEGIDHHSVPVDYQSFPFERDEENSGNIIYKGK